MVTGTHEVVLADRAAQNHTRVLGITDARTDGSGRLLFDTDIDINLVVGTWHCRGFHGHFLEVAQTLQPHLGLVNQVRRCPATFHLTHFAAQYFVTSLGVATEVDTVDVSSFARINHIGNGDGIVFIMRLRHAADVGKGVTLITEATGNQLGRSSHHFA